MGPIGKRHAANVRSLGHEVIAYDPNIQVQEAIKHEYPTCWTRYDLWRQKLDAVLVCAPPKFHWDLTLEAISQRVPVFIEKPLGHEMDGWEEATAFIQQRNLVNMVACNWRWHEAAVKLKAAIDLGVVHRPWRFTAWHHSYLPKWRPGVKWREHYSSSKEQGGVTLEVAWHLVDLACWLFGDAQLTSAEIEPAKELRIEADGYAGMELRHAGGVKSNIEVDFRYRQNNGWSFIVEAHLDRISWDSKRSKRYDINQMYLDEMQYFLSCVEAHEPTINPVGQAIKTLEILLKAREKGR